MFGVISILIFVLTPVLLFYVLFLIMMLFFLASLSLNPGGVGHGPKGIMGKKSKTAHLHLTFALFTSLVTP